MKITSIQRQVKRADRYSIFVDGAYAFSLSESALLTSGLASGRELDAAELRQFKEMAGVDKAYGQALRYVAIRPRSEWEIATYLQRKDVDADAAHQIIDRLRAVNLLDDAEFARMWVANRRLLKSSSKRRLMQELQQKHVAPEIIEHVVGNGGDGERSDRTALRELIAKKLARYPDRQKFMQYLARQGFGYDDIKSVLNEIID